MRTKGYRDSFVLTHASTAVAAQVSSMRHSRGLTEEALAAAAGVTVSDVQNLEDPDFENAEFSVIQKLASAFDVGFELRFVPFSSIAHQAWSAKASDDVVSFEYDSIADFLHQNVQPSASHEMTYILSKPVSDIMVASNISVYDILPTIDNLKMVKIPQISMLDPALGSAGFQISSLQDEGTKQRLVKALKVKSYRPAGFAVDRCSPAVTIPSQYLAA